MDSPFFHLPNLWRCQKARNSNSIGNSITFSPNAFPNFMPSIWQKDLLMMEQLGTANLLNAFHLPWPILAKKKFGIAFCLIHFLFGGQIVNTSNFGQTFSDYPIWMDFSTVFPIFAEFIANNFQFLMKNKNIKN